MRYFVFIGLVALALIFSSCAQPVTSPAPAQPETRGQTNPSTPSSAAIATSIPRATSAPAPGQSITLPGNNGQSLTLSNQATDALKAFPVPPGFALDKDGFATMSSSQGFLTVGSWSGTSDVPSVADFYAKTLPQQGWTQDFAIKTDSGASLTYHRADLQATITVDKQDSGTKISVLMGTATKTPTAVAEATAVAEEPTATTEPVTAAGPVPTDTPAPPLASASAIPAELKGVPVPVGFQVKADTESRLTSGGKLALATVVYFGSASVSDVAAFYKQGIGTAWTEGTVVESEEQFVATYVGANDPTQSLTIAAVKTDAGTEITLYLRVSG